MRGAGAQAPTGSVCHLLCWVSRPTGWTGAGLLAGSLDGALLYRSSLLNTSHSHRVTPDHLLGGALMAWYKVGFCRLVWQLEQRRLCVCGGGGSRSLVSSQPETRGQPRLRKRGGRPGLALGSVLSAPGQALNQEGREARAGPDLLGAAIRILAS